jgi:hypothetical protein
MVKSWGFQVGLLVDYVPTSNFEAAPFFRPPDNLGCVLQILARAGLQQAGPELVLGRVFL